MWKNLKNLNTTTNKYVCVCVCVCVCDMKTNIKNQAAQQFNLVWDVHHLSIEVINSRMC